MKKQNTNLTPHVIRFTFNDHFGKAITIKNVTLSCFLARQYKNRAVNNIFLQDIGTARWFHQKSCTTCRSLQLSSTGSYNSVGVCKSVPVVLASQFHWFLQFMISWFLQYMISWFLQLTYDQLVFISQFYWFLQVSSTGSYKSVQLVLTIHDKLVFRYI